MRSEVRELLVQQGTAAAREHPAQVDRGLRSGARVFWRRFLVINCVVALAALVFTVGLGGAGQVAYEAAAEDPPPPTLTLLTVEPTDPQLFRNGTRQLSATARFDDGSTRDVTGPARWHSSRPRVARVSESGLVSGLRHGRTKITAVFDGMRSGTRVRVEGRRHRLGDITVTPPFQTATPGQHRQFSAFARYRDGSTRDVTTSASWTTDEPLVATVGDSGIATAVAPGRVRVSAEFNGERATAELRVTTRQVRLKSITIDPAAFELPVGEGRPLTASGTYSDGTNSDISERIIWAANPTEVASIDGTRLVTALSPGRATITATLDGVTGTATVTVVDEPPSLRELVVLPETSNICAPTETVQLSATGVYGNGKTEDISSDVVWSSDDMKVADVDDKGLVTRTNSGTTDSKATITATITTADPTSEGSAATELTDSVVVSCSVVD